MIEAPKFTADYRRDAGVHTLAALDGTPLTALAFPTWEGFAGALDELPATEGYIVSPELITAPYPVPEIKAHQEETEARVAAVQELSRDHPQAVVLLGTPTLSADGLARNSLAVISAGAIQGYVDKRGVMWPVEGREFSRLPRQQEPRLATLASIGHSALICSDIITAATQGLHAAEQIRDGWIPPTVETLLISSCWAIPQFDTPGTPRSHEERFKGALESTISQFFRGYPGLKEIIMVDRAVPTSEVEPYTAQFRKVESGSALANAA